MRLCHNFVIKNREVRDIYDWVPIAGKTYYLDINTEYI